MLVNLLLVVVGAVGFVIAVFIVGWRMFANEVEKEMNNPYNRW